MKKYPFYYFLISLSFLSPMVYDTDWGQVSFSFKATNILTYLTTKLSSMVHATWQWGQRGAFNLVSFLHYYLKKMNYFMTYVSMTT